jgi:hypothetical protein
MNSAAAASTRKTKARLGHEIREREIILKETISVSDGRQPPLTF